MYLGRGQGGEGREEATRLISNAPELFDGFMSECS